MIRVRAIPFFNTITRHSREGTVGINVILRSPNPLMLYPTNQIYKAKQLREYSVNYLTKKKSKMSTGSSNYSRKYKAAVVGSGNWGTAVAKLVAENCAEKNELFEKEVKMWVFEEKIDGKNLTEIINTEHENVKYLPDIKLPENLVANPDLRDVVMDADIIVINIPHQFLRNICKQLADIDFSKKYAISCLKGLNISPKGPELLSDYIVEHLGLHCGVLSGANIASEVAKEKWCETTVAFPPHPEFKEGDPDALLMRELFERPYFHVQVSEDTAGVSIGGALKNVIAIGAGIVEGAGWGDNAKSGIMRHGIVEMVKFGKTFFPTFKARTICYESAGVADLITTCSAGRNVKVAREAIRQNRPIEEIEKELLNGQSAQGVITMDEVHELLTNQNIYHEFPLMAAIYKVIREGLPVEGLVQQLLEARDD